MICPTAKIVDRLPEAASSLVDSVGPDALEAASTAHGSALPICGSCARGCQHCPQSPGAPHWKPWCISFSPLCEELAFKPVVLWSRKLTHRGGAFPQGLVRQAEIVDVDSSDSDEDGMGDSHTKAEGEEGAHHGGAAEGSAPGQAQGCTLYTRGVRSCHFTLVLQARSVCRLSLGAGCSQILCLTMKPSCRVHCTQLPCQGCTAVFAVPVRQQG